MGRWVSSENRGEDGRLIAYVIRIRDADAHLIDVEMHIENPDRAGQVLSLPNWIPGSYMIRDFSRNIVQISAFAGDETVALTKLDKSTWRSAPNLDCLTVRYRVYAWDLSVRAAHVDRTHAFFNGTSVFLAAQGRTEEPHVVSIERPSHDHRHAFRLATSMSSEDVDDAGFGRYRADDHDELIDHPVEMGDFQRLSFEAHGVAHDVVFTGSCHFDEARLAADLKRICEYEIDFFGRPAPVERYVFLVMVVDTGYGGLEHRASTALMITRDSLPIAGQDDVSDGYLNFLGLCSHEYFHTWNVKRIKPARFIPYDLRKETHTELLWFFEGMTSYYDDLVLVRSGLIDEKRYLGLLARTLTRVQRGPGRLTQSVTESSFDAWHKFYRQDENAANAIVSYYAKGALIALCLDGLLRESGDGRRSLDSLMRLMWRRWLETQAGVEEDEPQRLASSLAETDLTDFFQQALYSTEALPLAQSLEQLGIELRWRSRTSGADNGSVVLEDEQTPQAESTALSATGKRDSSAMDPGSSGPWLGATVAEAPGGVRITQVLSGSPAERAGLAGGDLLVALNHQSVTRESLDEQLNRHGDLSDLPIHYFRLGQLHESRLPIEMAPADTAELRVVDGSRLKAWLHDEQQTPISIPEQ